MNWTKLTQPLQCKTHNYPHICQLKVNHASTNIMPIHCLSDDVCVSNQGTSNPCPPTTSLHGWGFHIPTLIRSSIGNGHTNTRPIRVRSPTYLKEQILYWSANYSQDAIIFKTRPGLAPTPIDSKFGQWNTNLMTMLTGRRTTPHALYFFGRTAGLKVVQVFPPPAS